MLRRALLSLRISRLVRFRLLSSVPSPETRNELSPQMGILIGCHFKIAQRFLKILWNAHPHFQHLPVPQLCNLDALIRSTFQIGR
jgi:hypothetical protein